MNPGRELDALIAEKVMGWIFSTDVGLPFPPGLHPNQNIFGHDIPHYSTDIAAACVVADKFPTIKLTKIMQTWWCRIGISKYDEFGNIITKVEECGKSAPHAICLAALKACRTEA